ncbi:MAG TPA: LysM peptidoglycan-binding domain-containing protein [Anaerolineales bacterium]|nr:LysM peptidoglycan-binding domain-containing protein [Anaerolineales bacterium]
MLRRIIPAIILVVALILVDFSTVQGESLPDSAYIPGVLGHPQSYSISCEARSAADLAGFWGLSIGETEFLQALPASDNPDQGYVGSPNDVWGRIPPHGYGVHADPVAETLRDFGLPAEAHHGLTWEDLKSEISAGHPVIVWVIGAMWSGTSVDYQATDGSTVQVAAFEHTMLMTGYSADSVEVIDAYSGQYQYYWLSAFLDSWSVLGNMAVFASAAATQPESPQPEIQGQTYTVQPGDYLLQLARDFKVSWLELADLNSISYPYNIFAGQVLQLPALSSQEVSVEPEPESTPVPADSTLITTYRTSLPLVVRNTVAPNKPTPTSAASDTRTVETVIVLHTDTLIGFGRSIGIAWHVLAKLNSLPPTYIVHPGEILRIK